MKFPFFASFILFIIFFSIHMRRSAKRESKASDRFWERELEANRTRRKSLDNLPYITIPFHLLPMQHLADSTEIQEIHNRLSVLSGQKIVNFTGKSNTDLKLEYGAPNITLLADYDQNYAELIVLLQKWAGILSDNMHPEAAIQVLEFAISIDSDIQQSYSLLSDLYILSSPEKMEWLIEKASQLKIAEPQKERLLTMLKSKDVSSLCR